MRFRLYYTNEDSHRKFPSTYSVDLDDLYGINLYQYDLVIGGENNGNLIINGGHPNNKFQYNIIHSLTSVDSSSQYSCIEKLRLFTQEIYDRYSKLCIKNQNKRSAFSKYIRHRKVHLISSYYDKLLDNYAYILDFSATGREIYDMLIIQGQIVQNDINKNMKDYCYDDKIYTESCLILKDKVLDIHANVNTWYWKVPSYVDHIATKYIEMPEISPIILSFI